jgi:hypothetical protein
MGQLRPASADASALGQGSVYGLTREWSRRAAGRETALLIRNVRRIAVAPIRRWQNDEVSPTVLRSGPYRFFFFASDRDEPPHVHVKREDKLAKFWLEPTRAAYNYGFSTREVKRIAVLVQENEIALLKAWNEYFDHNGRSRGGNQRSRH